MPRGTLCVPTTRSGRVSTVSPHFLAQIPYKELPREKIDLGKRNMKGKYDDDATLKGRRFIPEKY